MECAMKEKPARHFANATGAAQKKPRRDSAQGGMAALVSDSPLMAAQRKTLQGLFGSAAQLKGAEDDTLQGRFNAAQRTEEDEPTQRKTPSLDAAQRREATPKPNNTGLPGNLKAGIESLSGLSMNHVKVHYNSSMPAQINALAYAQGGDIHLAPGQERHLPHEAWHVVQQAQGRVKPTMQMAGGVAVNDDRGLEREADAMGASAMRNHVPGGCVVTVLETNQAGAGPVMQKLQAGTLNMVGEEHPESDSRRLEEKEYAETVVGKDRYWVEHEFEHEGQRGDPWELRIIYNLKFAEMYFRAICEDDFWPKLKEGDETAKKDLRNWIIRCSMKPIRLRREVKSLSGTKWPQVVSNYQTLYKNISDAYHVVIDAQPVTENALSDLQTALKQMIEFAHSEAIGYEDVSDARIKRSEKMFEVATVAVKAGVVGVWKVGYRHIDDMRDNNPLFHIEAREDFTAELDDYLNKKRARDININDTPKDTDEGRVFGQNLEEKEENKKRKLGEIGNDDDVVLEWGHQNKKPRKNPRKKKSSSSMFTT
jgi:hypothetical protein